MTAMSQIELDSVKTSNFSAIDKFYENNLSEIVKLDSPSPSLRTCSSISSKSKGIDESDGSTCPSDSEPEELELNAIRLKEEFLKFHQTDACQPTSSQLIGKDGNLMLVNHSIKGGHENALGTKIDSIAIQNSTDIQFGNKTFYQGPVYIKINKRWIPHDVDKTKIENGIENKAFDDSADTKATEQKKQTDKPESCEDNNQTKIKTLLFTRKNFILTALTTIAIFLGIVLLSIFLIFSRRLQVEEGDYGKKTQLSDGDDSRRNDPIKSTIGNDLQSGKVLRMITRKNWLAQPPANELANLKLPVSRVVIAHTASEPCDTQASCTLAVRLIQTFHMESQSWDDIGYNFLIGGDGAVYEGRGWDKQGAHTKGYNTGSIGVAYIGTFTKIKPNERQINAGFLLMDEGVRLKKLVENYKIYGHRQMIASESPGQEFFETIKTWKHWANDTPEVFN